METFTFPRHDHFGEVFGIIQTLSGTYVVPGWYPVPEGTTREQIFFEEDTTPPKQKEAPRAPENKSYEASVAGSKPGKFYTVKFEHNRWSCTCPAATFQRGDCKHVKQEQKKFEKV
jgi:hypothetical protein